MTADRPAAGFPQEVLFASASATYARYRPGIPDAAVRLLAGALEDRPDPTLLDLGTGTAQVPLALLAAVPHLAHIEAVDVSALMLEQARSTLTPRLGECGLTLVHASADAYTPLAELTGAAHLAPDLITFCRSYHWMDGPAVLEIADRVAAPGAVLAIMGDGSLWTHQATWTRALRELIQRYLGPGRRAGTEGSYTVPRRSYEEDLAASAWSEVTAYRFPVTRTWAPDDVIGYLRTTSYASEDLFGERHEAFEEEARSLLRSHADTEPLVENAVFTVRLARRPEDAR